MLVSAHLMAADIWPIPMRQMTTAHDTIFYGMELSAVASNNHSPFWMHALENGNISKVPYSGNITAAIFKESTSPSRWYDYDFGVALTGRFDTEKNTGYFRSLYAHVRLYIIDITAGIIPLVSGAQNPRLTTGGLLFSENAYPIPRVSIGIDQYTPIPGLYGYLEAKAGLTHGWFADSQMLDPTIHTTNALLHYKYIGLRLGGAWPINISYEFHHAAQWSGVSPKYGKFPSTWNSYKHIFLARSGGDNLNDQLNAEGNHIGFQELAITAKWNQWNITAYWQIMFEDKSVDFIGRGNQVDGLWGLSIRQKQWPFINAITYEFLNTTQQNGPWHDKDGLVYGGQNNYYNNINYQQGWTHFGNTIGSAMLTPENNRVRTHFIGMTGDVYGYKYRLIASHSRNWGTYKNPLYLENTGILLELNKDIPKAWGINMGIRLAADIGTQYGNNFGAMLTVSKQGIIHSY